MSERKRNWNEVDGEKQAADSRDKKVKHIERNDHQYVTKMTMVNEQE